MWGHLYSVASHLPRQPGACELLALCQGARDAVMEKAGGKPSFLATLGDPQVTLVSVHKRWSFRRPPGAWGSTRPVPEEEEEGKLSQKGLNGARGVSGDQVSALQTLRSPGALDGLHGPWTLLPGDQGTRGPGAQGSRRGGSPGREPGRVASGGTAVWQPGALLLRVQGIL